MRKFPEENPVARCVKRGHAVLVGYGLDDSNGHLRYTRGDEIELMGGSETAHTEMLRRARIIQDELARLGISLDTLTYDEYKIAKDVVERVNCD